MVKVTSYREGFVLDVDEIPEDEDFIVYGTIHPYPENDDKLEAVYAEITKEVESEPRAIYYSICRDRDDPNIFHIYERYKGLQGLLAHVSKPLSQKLNGEWKYFRGVKAYFPPPKLRTTEELGVKLE